MWTDTMDYNGIVRHGVVYLLLLLITHARATVGMECFSCKNVRNVSECHSTADCGTDEFCYMEATTNRSHVLYNLGCRHNLECSGMVDSIMGRRASGLCHQCCSTDYCNKKLCMFNGGTQSNVCHDDAQYNCAVIGTTFDICSDVNHAKLVCKTHCGLCDLVDGAWSPWSTWSICDQSCGIGGMKLRMRSCSNPPPAHGGSDCPGQMMETANCSIGPCPVNGGWSVWAAWSMCDSTCDLGHNMRIRHCNNPSPAHGGIGCQGVTMERENCSLRPCPVDGSWSQWGSWSNCDRTCGQSERLRIRTCTNPTPAHGGKNCAGSQMDVTDCKDVPLHCPIDGGWAHWTALTTCSKTCGAGLNSRTRNCSNPIPMYNGKPCFGASEEYKVCVQQACSDGSWSPWSSWTNCSVSCDGGLMSRSRSCDHPQASVYGKPCEGSDVEYVTCNKQNCPVQAVFFTVDTPVNSNSKANKLNFTNVVTNEGHGYDVSTGDFTASIPAIYHVSLTADGNSMATHNPECAIRHNGTDVTTIHTHAGTTSSSSAYVQMAVGDVLQVFCDGGVSFINTGGSTVFSGALVMKM